MLIFSSILIALFALIAIANWTLAIRWWLYKEKATMIPIIGGVLGCIGLVFFPWKGATAWCWVPLFIDIGCFGMVIGLIQSLIKK